MAESCAWRLVPLDRPRPASVRPPAGQQRRPATWHARARARVGRLCYRAHAVPESAFADQATAMAGVTPPPRPPAGSKAPPREDEGGSAADFQVIGAMNLLIVYICYIGHALP